MRKSQWLSAVVGAIAVVVCGFGSPVCTAAMLLHNYQLNGDFLDGQGGSAIVAEGGTIEASSYRFGENQGLTLASPGLTDPGNYSIEMRVLLDTIRGSEGSEWVKLIDFSDLTSDNGLYSFDDDGNSSDSILQFYPFSGTNNVFTPGEWVHVVLTRDSATQEVVAYGLGQGQLSFTDTGLDAVFSATDNVIRFLQDDAVTSFAERSTGLIDFIRIYDGALTAQEVEDLNTEASGAVVPEPSTGLLFAGLFGIGLLGRRRWLMQPLQ